MSIRRDWNSLVCFWECNAATLENSVSVSQMVQHKELSYDPVTPFLDIQPGETKT